MKLREIKTKTILCFEDEQSQIQGEFKQWYENGQLHVICHFRDGEFHGEYKRWHGNGQQGMLSYRRDGKFHGECKLWDSSGKVKFHTFHIDGREIIDFLMNPELYPSTPEEKTMFVLKYGNAPFIGDTNEVN